MQHLTHVLRRPPGRRRRGRRGVWGESGTGEAPTLPRFETACRSARRGGAGLALTEAAWFRLKRRHAALLDAAGFDRFLLDRVCLDGEAPLRCEAERVGAALGRVARPVA